MKFPDTASYLKAPVFAIVLALLAYLLLPVINTVQLGIDPFVLGAGLGGLVATLLAAIHLGDSGIEGKTEEKKSIFVGNLAFKANQQELSELFQPFGTVHSIRIMTDRVTRRPRGYGFVEMDNRAARKAIKALNGKDFLGRKLRVNEGNERRPQESNQNSQQGV